MARKRDDRSVTARQALLDGCISRYHDWQLNPQIASEADRDVAWYILDAENIVERIKRSRGPIFPRRFGKNSGSIQYEETQLGRDFLRLDKIDYASIFSTFPHHQLHPYIGLAEKYATYARAHQSPGFASDFYYLNLYAEKLKNEALSSAIQNKREAFLKRTRDNTRSLCNYVEKLCGKYDQLLAIHLDIGYSRFWLAQPTWAVNVTFEEAKAHRELLFFHLTKKFPYKLRGFAWKLEHSESRSFHYQLLLFFEAPETYKSAEVAWMVGELWQNQITCGKGMYFNRNVAEFSHPGIGLIRSTNKENITALKKEVIPRLLEPGKLIRLAIPGARTFDKGNMPKPDKRRRGRPPTKSQHGQ